MEEFKGKIERIQKVLTTMEGIVDQDKVPLVDLELSLILLLL